MFQFTPQLIPFIISALASVVLAWLILRLPSNSTTLFMLAVTVCVEFWTVGFILEIAATELDSKIALANLQFIGIDLLTVSWLGMTLSYTGLYKKWRMVVPFLLLVSLVDQIVIWTDPQHHWFRSTPELEAVSPTLNVLDNNYSTWYYLTQTCFINLVFLVTFILLVRQLLHSSGNYRMQIILLFASTLLPLVFNLLYVLGASPIPHLNFSTVGFSISGAILIWSQYRFGFMDLMPVARSLLVDKLRDSWIVLDRSNRVVDLNLAAENLFNIPRGKIIGMNIRLVLSGKLDLAAFFLGDKAGEEEIQIEQPDGLRHYNMSLNLLEDKRGMVQGRLIVLRDITRRVQLQQEREQLIQELQGALDRIQILSGLLPICASCKNVRDDRGYWHQVESYIEDHSELKFSHGICPDCIRKYYPDIAEGILSEQ